MLTEKDIGKRVVHTSGARGIARGIANQPGAACVEVTVAGGVFHVGDLVSPEPGFVTPGWTLDDAGAAPDRSPAIRQAEMIRDLRAEVAQAQRDLCAARSRIEEISDHLKDLVWVAGQIRSGEIPGVPADPKPASAPPGRR